LFLWFQALEYPAAGDIGAMGALAVVSLTILLALPALFRIGRWPEPVVPASTPRGVVFVSPNWARTFGRVREDLMASTRAEDDVLFLPQSHGLNFLLERGSPVPGLKLDPSSDGGYESGLIRSLARHPPVFVVVSTRIP
jgi:hypothetical protein